MVSELASMLHIRTGADEEQEHFADLKSNAGNEMEMLVKMQHVSYWLK